MPVQTLRLLYLFPSSARLIISQSNVTQVSVFGHRKVQRNIVTENLTSLSLWIVGFGEDVSNPSLGAFAGAMDGVCRGVA